MKASEFHTTEWGRGLSEGDVLHILRQHEENKSGGLAMKNNPKRSISRVVAPDGTRLILKEFKTPHFWSCGRRHAMRCIRSTGLMEGFTPQCRVHGAIPGSKSYFVVFGDCGEGSFFGEEYLSRGDIGDLYRECGRLLRAAHEAGRFHLDTKPANFVLNERSSGECPWRVCLVDCDNVREYSGAVPLGNRIRNLAQFLGGTGRLFHRDQSLWEELALSFQEGYEDAGKTHSLPEGFWDAFWKYLLAGRHIECNLPLHCVDDSLKNLRKRLH